MRVVQLIAALNPDAGGGGAELFGLRLAQALARAGVTSALATVWWRDTPAEAAWAAQLQQAGVTLLRGVTPGRRVRDDLLRATRQLRPLLRAWRADRLHSHAEYADLCALLLRHSAAVPRWIRSCHSPYEFATQPVARRLTDWLYPLCADRETAVTPALAAQLAQRPLARLRRRRVDWLPNGVDVAALQPRRARAAVRADLGIAPAAPLLICVARLAVQKGHDRLLPALARLRQQLPAELLLVGSGPAEAALRAQADALALSDALHWCGARSDTADLLAAADVAVLASRWEGLPTVMIEAALLGVPQVLADLPGTRLLIEDGVSGRLVDAAQPAALAAALADQLTQPQHARQLAQRARQRAAALTIEAAARQAGALYRG